MKSSMKAIEVLKTDQRKKSRMDFWYTSLNEKRRKVCKPGNQI